MPPSIEIVIEVPVDVISSLFITQHRERALIAIGCRLHLEADDRRDPIHQLWRVIKTQAAVRVSIESDTESKEQRDAK